MVIRFFKAQDSSMFEEGLEAVLGNLSLEVGEDFIDSTDAIEFVEDTELLKSTDSTRPPLPPVPPLPLSSLEKVVVVFYSLEELRATKHFEQPRVKRFLVGGGERSHADSCILVCKRLRLEMDAASLRTESMLSVKLASLITDRHQLLPLDESECQNYERVRKTSGSLDVERCVFQAIDLASAYNPTSRRLAVITSLERQMRAHAEAISRATGSLEDMTWVGDVDTVVEAGERSEQLRVLVSSRYMAHHRSVRLFSDISVERLLHGTLELESQLLIPSVLAIGFFISTHAQRYDLELCNARGERIAASSAAQYLVVSRSVALRAAHDMAACHGSVFSPPWSDPLELELGVRSLDDAALAQEGELLVLEFLLWYTLVPRLESLTERDVWTLLDTPSANKRAP
jgi:hypothetical protein